MEEDEFFEMVLQLYTFFKCDVVRGFPCLGPFGTVK